LWFNGRSLRRAFLRAQKRRNQKAKVNNKKNTLHERKGWKLKQRNRKSRFAFEFAIGFVAHTDTPHASSVQTDVAAFRIIAKESRDRRFALTAATYA
jgi:putative alpha-1,2-mannosidase